MDCALLQNRVHSGSNSSTSSRERDCRSVVQFLIFLYKGGDRVSISDITELPSINNINQMGLNDELCGYGMEADCGCLLYMMFPVQIKMQGQSFLIGQIMLMVAATLNQIKRDKAQLQRLSLRP